MKRFGLTEKTVKIIENILNVFLKTFITTLVIGYVIFNITYIRNDCPVNEGIFTICDQEFDIDESWEGRSIYDQRIIFYEYLNWIFDAITLDFGTFSETDTTEVFSYSFKALSLSMKLILFSLLFGLLLSIFFIFINHIPFLKKNYFVKDYIIEPFLSLSFIHLVIYAIYFYSFLTDDSFSSTLLLCFITALGSGVLFDYYTLLYNEHKNIMKKEYVVFAKDSGFNEYYFASKELLVAMIYISTSRVPIIFGGMIIIEILSGGVYQGVGFSIWNNLYKEPNFSAFYGSAFLTVSLFTFIYYLTEYIEVEVLDK